MLKIKIISILFILNIVHAIALPPTKDKITLSFLEVKDPVLEFVASDINNMILRKNKGFLWPVTKITFTKNGDKLFFDVMAIDNSWYNMFKEDETPYGYFVVNRRMFIVSYKNNTSVQLEEYFEKSSENIERDFYKPDTNTKSVIRNPKWSYLHKGSMATVVDSVNMGYLGR